MKVSEMIVALQAFKNEHGDLDVETYSPWMGRSVHKGPWLAHRKILTGRESKDDFWSPYGPRADINKGEPVCKL